MKYNVNVYQVVLSSEARNTEKERAFTKGIIGQAPTQEEFEKLYDKVLSFSLDVDSNNILEVCEHCFVELNHEEIYKNPEKSNLKIHSTFRSLSVGDLLEIDNKLYLVRIIGFSEFPCQDDSKDMLGLYNL